MTVIEKIQHSLDNAVMALHKYQTGTMSVPPTEQLELLASLCRDAARWTEALKSELET